MSASTYGSGSPSNSSDDALANAAQTLQSAARQFVRKATILRRPAPSQGNELYLVMEEWFRAIRTYTRAIGAQHKPVYDNPEVREAYQRRIDAEEVITGLPPFSQFCVTDSSPADDRVGSDECAYDDDDEHDIDMDDEDPGADHFDGYDEEDDGDDDRDWDMTPAMVVGSGVGEPVVNPPPDKAAQMSALSEDHTCAAPTARSIEACPPPSAFDQGLEFDDLTLEAAMDTPSRQETMSPPASITKAAPAGLESLDSGRSVASSKTKEIKRRVGPSDHADNRPDGPPGSSASRLKRQRTAEPGSRTKSKDPRGAVAAAAAVDEDPLYVRRPDTSRAAPAHELPRTLAAPHFATRPARGSPLDSAPTSAHTHRATLELRTLDFIDLIISLVDMAASQIDMDRPFLGLSRQVAFDLQAVLRYIADRGNRSNANSSNPLNFLSQRGLYNIAVEIARRLGSEVCSRIQDLVFPDESEEQSRVGDGRDRSQDNEGRIRSSEGNGDDPQTQSGE